MRPRLLRPWLCVISGFLATGCVQQRQQERKPSLRPGIRVEASGAVGENRAREIDEKPAESSLEVTGPIEVQQGGPPRLLGVPIVVDKSTEFEDSDRRAIDPVELSDGLWVRVKGEPTADGSFKARKVRLQKPGRQWEAEGVISALEVDPEGSGGQVVLLGPFRLHVDAATDLQWIDRQKEWDDFLRQGPLGRRATKDQKFLPYTIPLGDRARLGGHLSFSYERDQNRDLNDDRERDRDQIELGAKLSAVVRLGSQGFLLAEAQFEHDSELNEEAPNSSDADLEVSELYVFLPNTLLDGLHLQVGRQDLDEQREWLYDQIVDGARVYWDGWPINLEGSASVMPKLLNAEDPPPSVNLVGAATWMAAETWRLTAYVVDRRSRDLQEFSPFHYGIRSYVKPDPGWSHWLELSRADGIVDHRRLAGFGADLGATYVLEHDLEPSITVAWAHGSGDDGGGEVDHTFRQTGLQDNNDKWNGVTSFRYYGEVFDPELTNLELWSLGLGLRPTRQTSVDLVYHGYRQDVAVAGSLHSNLRAPSNGVRRHLGEEVDLILGYRSRSVTLELVAGVFEPGAAFDNDDLAWIAAFEVRYKF